MTKLEIIVIEANKPSLEANLNFAEKFIQFMTENEVKNLVEEDS